MTALSFKVRSIYSVFYKLHIIRGGCGISAASRPVRVEEFAAWFVGAFVRVRAEVVTLRLQQICRQAG